MAIIRHHRVPQRINLGLSENRTNESYGCHPLWSDGLEGVGNNALHLRVDAE
jgi:hypothetical protein